MKEFTPNNPSPDNQELKITNREKALYKIKDELGEVGAEILERLFEKIRPLIEYWSYGTEEIPEISLDDFRDITKNLKPAQQDFLETVVTNLNRDQKILYEQLNNSYYDDIIKNVSAGLHAKYQPTQMEATTGIELQTLPGAISVLIKDQELMVKMFPDHKEKKGFYYRPKEENKGNYLNGRLTVVNVHEGEVEETIQHEYLHFLTAMYFETNEIPPYADKETQAKLTELETLNQEINDLEDNPNQNQTLHTNLKRRRQSIQIELARITDESEKYHKPRTIKFFKMVRNELSAYSLSNEIQNDESKLIPKSIGWLDSIENIGHLPDQEKIKRGWNQLKGLLADCKEVGLPPKTLLPIFITSQSFEEIYKRIHLLLIDPEKTKSFYLPSR